ncbi:zinc finger protein BRUTUS-like At1g74770 isoform X1 [Lycium ferocissimum]|uniref:zinc finger protein BRUTUS-like At1g74770 isoform X1 n=2 Tax=Lycium ferocissimum TaxID=112874 RepID=UPI002815BCB0|nr:zinc finger protein BRUTUS-like At1g74770 isoform X1 [Lycium ferocissimum]
MEEGEPEKDVDMTSSLAGVKLVDAPILFFVISHKAITLELADIHRVAVEALDTGSQGVELIRDLSRRLEFLQIVYKYHCAAEDEVVFLALDAQVKNVVFTYSLEHKSIDDLFSSIFKCIDCLQKEKEDFSKLFNGLTCYIGTIESFISQHMLKEEKQIFPSLMKRFSSKEQARLVWQYLCSVPMLLLEDFLPWVITTLSSVGKADFLNFIHVVLPEETLIQELFISWLDNTELSAQSCLEHGKGTKSHYGIANMKHMLKLGTMVVHSSEMKLLTKKNPIDGFHLWHAAIRRDLKEILEELHQLRSSFCLSTLMSLVAQLKFFADVLNFYSIALDQIFYPLVDELTKNDPSTSHEQFSEGSQIEELQRLLYCKLQGGIQLNVLVEMLCQEVESFVGRISKKLHFLETQVFLVIRENCSHELQLWLLYRSLQMLPLGLLKCMIIWFSAHLSEDESKLILNNVMRGSPVVNKFFASLLYEWVRTGYSGKISLEKFRKDLEEMFSSRSSLLEKSFNNSGSSSSQLDMQSFDKSNNLLLQPASSMTSNNTVSYHSSSLSIIEKIDTSYSSGINTHIFFSDSQKNLSFFPGTSSRSSNDVNIPNREFIPIDFVHFFHKALRNDIQHVVSLSVKLAEDVGILAEFHRRFHLLHFLLRHHSNSEDEVAFPALESRVTFQNISHSYTLDHNLEVEHFNKVSVILSKLISLQDDEVVDGKKLRYKRLCLKLHNACMSMQQTLTDHINHEEIELWPLFREHFSVEEQEKIVGNMFGRTKAEFLQEIIPWLMASLTPGEQHSMMFLLRKVTRHTKFFEWLGEWWEPIKREESLNVEKEPKISPVFSVDPLEAVSTYLSRNGVKQGIWNEKGSEFSSAEFVNRDCCQHVSLSADKKHNAKGKQNVDLSEDKARFSTAVDKKKCTETDVCVAQKETTCQRKEMCCKSRKQEHHLMAQEELVAVIRRISCDSSLDSEKKSHLMQSLLMSQWIVTQKLSNSEVAASNDVEKFPGQCPSYRDEHESVFGCNHYKRNNKLLAPCCKKLFTCIRCHDETTDHDHSLDRKTITQMMCMKCFKIQPIGPSCSTPSCNGFSMGRYYCKICKLFDDERQIYHCPFCNLCRLGKGLGVDYFHCMNCNACMSKSLSVHVCREKCLEENCPICHEYIFTSTNPVKALPCGHLMHSVCFQEYTCTHYTCPICSKSLGDMQVYFEMLDALLSEQKIPEEYAGQTQAILCNDCEKRGTASFHWLYHKCSYCASYNTRLV